MVFRFGFHSFSYRSIDCKEENLLFNIIAGHNPIYENGIAGESLLIHPIATQRFPDNFIPFRSHANKTKCQQTCRRH